MAKQRTQKILEAKVTVSFSKKQPMQPQAAIKFLNKFEKWRTGKIDSWSKTKRIPPNDLQREFYECCRSALNFCVAKGVTFATLVVNDKTRKVKK